MKKLVSFLRGLGGCLYYGGMLLFSLAVFGGIFWWWFGPALVHLFGALYYFGVFLWRLIVIPALYVGGFLAAAAFVLYVASNGDKKIL